MEATSISQLGTNQRFDRVDVLSPNQIEAAVNEVLGATQFIDIHTHLYPPAFGSLGLWGVDELITYHYLEAEFFRFSEMTPEQYWLLSKQQQADAIWRTLFLENTPLSEATRGIITILKTFNLPTDSSDLTEARSFFREQSIDTHIGNGFRISGVGSVVMTNDPLDPAEVAIWRNGFSHHRHFQAVVRLDRILREWSEPWQQLIRQGYEVDDQASPRCLKEIRRFLADWCQRMRPVYMAVSLPIHSSFRKILSAAAFFAKLSYPRVANFNCRCR